MSRFPRAHRQALEQRDHANVDKAIRNSTGTDTNTPKTVARATLPGDTRRLRGIPVVGATTGTSPGSDPYLETCRRMGL
jgi:hypothetical protein